MACCGVASVPNKRLMVLLFFVALFVRLAVFFGVTNKNNNCWIYPDSVQYNTVAQHMFNGKGISDEKGLPQTYRLPGYPLFLVSVYKLCGQENIFYAQFAQVVLASAIPVLIVQLAAIFFPACGCFVWGAVLWAAIHPGLALYASMVATESLFLFFFLLFLILLFAFMQLQIKKTSILFLAGLILGCASLVRPVGHYLLIISCLLLLFSAGTCMQRFKSMMVLSSGWLLVVAGWLMRNFMLTGALFFHTLPGHHFLQYWAGYTLVEQEKKEFDVIRPRLLQEWRQAIEEKENDILFAHPECRPHPSIHFASQNTSDFAKSYAETRQDERSVYRRMLTTNGLVSVRPERNVVKSNGCERCSLNDYQKCCIAEKLAGKYIKQYPYAACKVAATQITKTCFSLYCAQPLLSDSGVWPVYTSQTTLWTKIKRFLVPATNNLMLIFLIYLELLLHLLMWLGLLFFAFLLLRDKAEWSFFLKTVPFVGLIIFITLAYGCARLRLPIEPFLILYACRGWLWMCGAARDKHACSCV